MARKYEAVFILNPAIGDEAITATTDKVKALIESAATIEQMDVWGRRRLAYEIDDQKEGYYVLVNFSSEAEFPKELERVLKITDGVMRYMVVRADG
ncbi:MAG: 30S ribosomal protein S6 [Eubacteriales bacterium]|nr:30S ribosomal protein S6 [Eubacteriales bacterium]MDD3197455.1 30S ribosomal protein S6 [Eubacteriales bacterium]MDD3503600.1 30S ribosomal protein S6 [Eubacteriales bacterium]MDD4682558.1 30S ribosomal protein S6 [Eubacteriales bacterium]